MNRDAAAAFGGDGFRGRAAPHGADLGVHWARCGSDSEWGRLKAVIMHRPGAELRHSADPDRALMLEPVDAVTAGVQHDGVASALKMAGVKVHYLEPEREPPPNLMFCADLVFMTPEGAVLGRPASEVRAGEVRAAARRLAAVGVPILLTVRGEGCFEGADALWVDPGTVLLSIGRRTNREGVRQVAALLGDMGVEGVLVEAPAGTMHLMGQVRFLDAERAVVWPGRVPGVALDLLRSRGVQVLEMPHEGELLRGWALNFVTLGPGEVLMPAGNPESQAFLEAQGVTCQTPPIDEITKAAGGIGCLTGVVWRERAHAERG